MSMSSQLNDPNPDFRQIVEQTSDAIIILQNGQIIYSNRAARNLFSVNGAHASDVPDLTSLLTADDQTIIQKKIRRILSNQSIKECMSTTIHRPDGTTIPIDVTVHPLRMSNRPSAQLTLRDISELRAAEEGMIRSEKLSVVGELAAGILHEVRNPLTAIKGFLQLMQNEPQVSQKYIDIILNEVEHIENIANRLLYLTRPNQDNLKTHDLQEIVTDSMTLFENEASRKNIVLQIASEERPYGIRCDRTQIKQVFVNLIKNAIEATPEYGRITLTLSANAEQVRATVADTGKGIPKSLTNKIGQSFFTTKTSGTGLGLMVSFNIIKNHGGTLTFESVEDKGTTFTLTFPIKKS